MLFFICCSSAEKNVTQSAAQGDARALLEKITLINNSAPVSYDMTFTAEALMNNQKYKLNGNAQFDKTAARLSLFFTDFIFKSPISMMFNDGESVVMYFPSEKKLYRYNKNTIDFRSLWNVNLDYPVVHDIMTGRIPVIDGYTVKEAVLSADSKTSYLILENSRYYETISFKNDIPDKIKIMDKSNRSETDFYFSGAKKYGESFMFKKISIVSKAAWRFDVAIDSLKVNVPMKVKTINDIQIPLDVIGR